MGLGGDLMLEASLRAYAEHTGYRVCVALRPRFSDLIRGRLFRPIPTDTLGLVLKEAPYLINEAGKFQKTYARAEFIDSLVERLLRNLGLYDFLSDWLQKKCYWHAKKFGVRYVYKDDSRFSYAEKVLKTKMIWKDAHNAVDASLMGFFQDERPPKMHPQRKPQFYNLERDENSLASLLIENNIDLGSKFIAVEVGTNTEWFAELRAWPSEYWRKTFEWFGKYHSDYKVVQVGLNDGSEAIENSIDLRGQTTFRQASALLKRASLFIGTEGGLMHAARAVSTPSVILWGGVTRPDFAGYPDSHIILFAPLDCLHCGLLGNCPHNAKCMKNIHIISVCRYIDKALMEYRPALINLNHEQ